MRIGLTRTSPAIRGFTLIEMGITLAIIGIIAGMAVTMLSGVKTNTNFTAAVAGIKSALQTVRADSYGSQYSTVFVVNQTTGQYWGIEDDAGNFNLLSFNPTTPAPAPDRLLLYGQLPSPAAFGPADGYGQILPQPFAATHADNACTFCNGSPNPPFGAITFNGRDGITFTGPNSTDGSFTLESPDASGKSSTHTTVAIVGRTGAIDSFNVGG